MNRPPTPAGPLFVKRGANPRLPLSDNNGSGYDGGITGRLPPGGATRLLARHGPQTIIYDLQKRTTTDSTRIRRPLGNIDRNVPRDYSFLNIADRLQHSREKDSENRTRRVLLPVVAGQQARVTSGKSVRFGSGKHPPIDAAIQTKEFPSPSLPAPPRGKPLTSSAKKTVKFQVEEKTVNPALSSGSSAKSDNKQNDVPTFCEVKGSAINQGNKTPEHLHRRVVRRPPTSVVNSLSMYRQQLIAKQSQEAKYATDTTKLPSECVIRRPEPESSNLRETASPPRNARLIYRIPAQPPGLRGDMHLPQSDGNETAPAQVRGIPNLGNIEEKRFSYKLAEKAEELFTQNLRHHESGKTPNVVKTYVVEDDPNALLAKLDNSPASLTTKNLEMHNSWWTSVENKEKICQTVNVREKRIQRWIAEMESTSRLNRMRVVNIIVKDRGYPVRSPRDDALDRLSQVPSQVMV